MANKKCLNFGKEERLAFVILMFFTLAWFSPSIWNNFDKVKDAFASTSEGIIGYKELQPQPSGFYVVEKFFKDINYYDYESASELILENENKEEIFNIFKGLYSISIISINFNNTEEANSYKVRISTINDNTNPSKIFKGIEEVNVFLKKDKSENWKIFKISY